MVPKGSWVGIHKIILHPHERAPQVPDDTKKVPLEMWVKGYLLDDANMGEICKIKTMTSRIEEGTLTVVNPSFKHNYGEFVPEILEIGQIVKQFMFGDDVND